MRSKLQVQLEEAYQLVLEGKGAPCPCTMGKKCTKKGCKDCKACQKQKSMNEETDFWGGMPRETPPTAGAASRAGATGGADFETAFTKAKIVLAKVDDDLEELMHELQKLHGGRDLDPKIKAIFDRINDRIETIVPTEDY